MLAGRRASIERGTITMSASHQLTGAAVASEPVQAEAPEGESNGNPWGDQRREVPPPGH
jgi:hypothetical protein